MFKSLFGAKKDSTCVMSCLVKSNRVAEKAYRRAADIVKDDDLKQKFLRLADQRALFATDLSSQIRHLGGEPPVGGPFLAEALLPLRMAYLKWRGGDAPRMIAAAESGEDCAMKAYTRALESKELKGEARELVQRQMSGIRKAHNAMRQLELRTEQKELPEEPA